MTLSSQSGAGTAGHSILHNHRLTHGTVCCRDIAKSRRFYEEFLGLEVVHVTKPAMLLRLGGSMYIACVCLGEKVPENTMWSHFGFNVDSKEEVDRAHEAALRLQQEYELRVIENPQILHGAYQFYLQDRDSNWWEIQYEPRTVDDFFAMPDRDAAS
jgi:catechol 2,3-dioxygenase-like lactoylglutathione lyase family enzyme